MLVLEAKWLSRAKLRAKLALIHKLSVESKKRVKYTDTIAVTLYYTFPRGNNHLISLLIISNAV